jgi:hypothetical protein
VAIRPIAEADVLPYGLPLHGSLGGLLGVGFGAFVVTAALAGRDGIVDLGPRSVRWRVAVRWYLVALHRSSRCRRGPDRRAAQNLEASR